MIRSFGMSLHSRYRPSPNHTGPSVNRPPPARRTMALSAPTNIKKLLLPVTLAKAGWAIVEAREDVQGVPYDVTAGKAELHRLLEDVAGVALVAEALTGAAAPSGPRL